MTDLRLGRLQDALRAKEEALEQLIGEREGIEVERSADPSDEAQLASERELKIRALDRDFGMLCEVRLALQRINDGGYGFCQNCDERISEKRLAALPWALYCIDCQELRDREPELQEFGVV